MRKSVMLAVLLCLTNAEAAKRTYPDLSKIELYQAFTSKDPRPMVRRNVANNMDLKDEDLSNDFRKFRTDFQQIKTPDELDAFLDKLAPTIPNLSPDMRVVASTMMLLKPFRGIDSRVGTLLDKSYGIRGRLQLLLGNSFRAMELFLPGTEWQVIREYMIVPTKKQAQKFNSISELQNYLVTDVYPALTRTAQVTNEVYNNTRDSKYYVFDNQMLYGKASFQDGLQRYRAFGRAELAFMTASLYGSLHELSFFVSYNFDNAFIAMDMLRHGQYLTKLTKFNFLNIAGEHTKLLRSHKNLLTFREEKFSKEMMKRSYDYLVQAVYATTHGWRDLELRSNDQDFMINGEYLRSQRSKFEMGIENLTALVESKDFHPVKSQVTGEVVWVNLYAFFHNPPSDLKIFLPTDFKGGKHQVKTPDGLTYNDYSVGRPQNWNYDAISPYMKSSPNKMDSMDRMRRVLSGALGGRQFVKIHSMIF